MASRTPRILCVDKLSRSPPRRGAARGPALAGPRPKTSPRSSDLQKAKGRRDLPGEWRRSTCSSDNVRAGCGPTVFAHRGRVPAGASSSCWLRFRLQRPDGWWARRPTAHASAPFFGNVRTLLFGGGQSFLKFQPSRRGQKSMVEVRKGLSMREPNSAEVASGCSAKRAAQPALPLFGEQRLASTPMRPRF